MKKKKKVCKSKCKSKNCDSPCSKTIDSKTVKKIISTEPLVYIEPLVPSETLWTKILKFLRLR